jgi:predicted TIM-barrel fold metal-dependent hydrolase
MKFIDFHTHVFPDELAERALLHIANDSGITPSFDGTVAGLKAAINDMPEWYCAVNCPVATKPEQVDSINIWASTILDKSLYSFGAIHPDSKNKSRILAEIKQYGLKGIKLHPEYQKFNPLDDRMTEIWEYCVEHNMIIITHAGIDAGISENVLGTPERFAKLIERYPKMKLICAHFGGWFSWNEVNEYLIGSNVLLDLSFTLGLIDNDFLVDMINRHGAEKILYGTDTPWRNPEDYIKLFMQLNLTDEQRELILYKNAAELLF